MLNGFRTIGAAAFWALALGFAVSGIEAQETNTVGNPQIRDFELPGQRTVQPRIEQPAAPPISVPAPGTPAPAGQAPAAQAPAPETAAPAPAARVRTAPAANRRAPAPPPRQTSPAQPSAAAPDIAASPGPAPVELQQALPQPAAPAPVPTAPIEAPPPAETAAAEPGPSVPWLYLGIGALGLLLGFLAVRRLRRRSGEADAEPAYVGEAALPEEPVRQDSTPAPVRAQAAAAAPPPPAPAPAPLANDLVGIQIRPWLELEFKPDRAAATATEATIQYELTIRNTGNRAARDVRIEARMFNAGAEQEQEIGAFFAEPVRERTPPALPALAPRSEVKLRRSIVMPKENVREINVQGRRLFIPTIAFNVIYDWGENRSGQTSTSYVVGREAEAPAERMGPFRLDLGPRLYRSVGQRQTKLARIV